MKRKIQSLVIAGLLLVIAIACQREEKESLENKGISLEEAKAFFEKQETEKENNGIDFKITPKWETFKEGGKNSNGEFFAYVQIQTTSNSEIIFTKKGDSLSSKIVLTNNSHKRTKIGVFDYKGNFIHGYFIKNDTIMQVHLQPKSHNLSAQIVQKKLNLKLYLSNFFKEDGNYPEETIEEGKEGGGGEEEKTIYLSPVEVVGQRKNYRSESSSYSWGYFLPYNYNSSGYFEDDYREKVNDDNLFRGGGSSPSYNEAPEQIIDNLTNPCAKNLLKQLPNLKNDIAKLLKETFQTNDKYDIVFTEDNNLIGQNIDGTASGFKESGSKKVATIALNPDILKTATKEYILVTMYHEVIHTYLNFERERLGKVDFEKKYPNIYMHHTQGIYNGKAYSKLQFLVHNPRNKEDHHFKFEKYIDRLTNSILSLNPKMSRETAQAMAKVGIIRESELFDWEKQLNQNEREGKNHQGEKCN